MTLLTQKLGNPFRQFVSKCPSNDRVMLHDRCRYLFVHVLFICPSLEDFLAYMREGTGTYVMMKGSSTDALAILRIKLDCVGQSAGEMSNPNAVLPPQMTSSRI